MAEASQAASIGEFGLWYEDSILGNRFAMGCLLAAAVTQNRSLSSELVIDAIVSVLEAHEELRYLFYLDGEGELRKKPGESFQHGINRYRTGTTGPKDFVGKLSAYGLRIDDGRLIDVAIVEDSKGLVKYILGVVHHITWDAGSEKLFWTELDRGISERIARPFLSAAARNAGFRNGPEVAGLAGEDHQGIIFRPDQTSWDYILQRSAALGTSPFSWLIGQLASAVAKWSAKAAVLPMLDFNYRELDPASKGRFGFYQTQRTLPKISRGVTPDSAAQAVHSAILEMICSFSSESMKNERELVPTDVQPCKFYLRDMSYSDQLRNLRLLDLSLPAARNSLSIGMSRSTQGLEVLVTARAENFTERDVDELSSEIRSRVMLRSEQAD